MQHADVVGGDAVSGSGFGYRCRRALATPANTTRASEQFARNDYCRTRDGRGECAESRSTRRGIGTRIARQFPASLHIPTQEGKHVMKLQRTAIAAAIALSIAVTAFPAANTTSSQYPTSTPPSTTTSSDSSAAASTPSQSPSVSSDTSSTTSASLGANDQALVRDAQQALKDKGFNAGKIDGKMGPKTQAALKNFQQSKGLTTTASLDSQTLSALGVQGSSASPSSSSAPSSSESTSSSSTPASTPSTPSTTPSTSSSTPSTSSADTPPPSTSPSTSKNNNSGSAYGSGTQ